MDNKDDEEIQPYQFEPEWSPGELDTPEYSDNDTDTSDSSSDLEFGGVEPQGWRLYSCFKYSFDSKLWDFSCKDAISRCYTSCLFHLGP